MAFNIEVISTAALTVQLTAKHLNYSEVEVPENDPNHVYDRIEIAKIFTSIFDKLSTTTTPVYHRLKYSKFTGPNSMIYPRAAVSGSYFIDLIPLGTHITAGTDIPNGHIGFATAENSYDVLGGDTLAHKAVARVEKRRSAQQYSFRFELQYQVDPMTGPGGTSIGRNAAGTWVTYQEASSSDIILVDADGAGAGTNDLQVRVRTTTTQPDNYDPGVNNLTRLYKRHTYTSVYDASLPETLTISGVTYTAENILDDNLPLPIAAILFTGVPGAGTIREDIDYALYLSDDNEVVAPNTLITDYSSIDISAKGDVDLQRYLLRSSTDTVPINGGEHSTTTVDVKVFRDKTTRFYTTLIWPDVHGYLLKFGNDEQTFLQEASEFGFFDFENGETRVGISIDANHRVYLIVKLGIHSTSLLLERLVVAQGPPVKNPFEGTGVGTTFYDAPPNYENIL